MIAGIRCDYRQPVIVSLAWMTPVAPAAVVAAPVTDSQDNR